MINPLPRAVVAGHICLDLIPAFEGDPRPLDAIFAPGALAEVGPAAISTGGAVSNTGIALHKLGVPTTLVAKVGDDPLGAVTRNVVESHGVGLSDGLVAAKGGSSYSVVLNPPGIDRMFLHYAGPNDDFSADDVSDAVLEGAAALHFGYPPLMRRMFENEGRELEALFTKAKAHGVMTSLDVTMPDPRRAQGRAPWRRILERVLPHVDLFVPSIDEVSFMLDPSAGALAPERAAETLLGMGTPLVLLKLGEAGLYLRTVDSPARLAFLDRFGHAPAMWAGLELTAPAFEVEVLGTTGCGDSTIAGFIAAVMRGLQPREALDVAAAAGACTAERLDALSGVPTWDCLRTRMARPWPRKAHAAPSRDANR